MNEELRITRMIYDAFVAVVEAGQDEVRPGHVIENLREQNHPLGIWNVTGEFANLEGMGVIKLNKLNATWSLVRERSFDDAIANPNGNSVKLND